MVFCFKIFVSKLQMFRRKWYCVLA